MKSLNKLIAACMALLMLFAVGCAAPANSNSADTSASDYEASLAERLNEEDSKQQAKFEKEWKDEIKNSPITTKTLSGYLVKPEDTFELDVTFLKSYEDVPFMEIEAFADSVLVAICALYDKNYEIDVKTKGKTVTFTRDNGSAAVFDFENNFISFDNMSRFMKMSYKSADIDVLSTTGFNEKGEPEYFKRTENVFERTSSEIIVDMDKYYIPMVFRNGKGYLPLQTLNDLFFINAGFNILYNGEELFIISGSNLNELEELYYSVEPGERSEQMAFFNFCELCLALDLYYGLAEAHNIESFHSFFADSGLYEDLLSEDGAVYSRAMHKLAFGYLADKHTALTARSHYVSEDEHIDPFDKGSYSLELMDSISLGKKYSEERKKAYPNGIPGYEEIGNTAYVTFDAFLVSQQDYYSEPATAEAADTMGLVAYAHSRIMRKNSPIENVVIDLSNNGGGQADAAIYVIGWFLGTCNINFVDTINGGQSSVEYMVDVNMDREFDENDTVADKNLYCIISPNSFSCGNLVPATFKNSGKVTLIGQPSGGGACVVMEGSTADGTIFRYSSNQRLSTVLNGAYTDVDSGVTPDIPITKINNFYDRDFLTQFINSLP